MSLDTALLRTFLAIAETGSVTAGAVSINRSQSAASLQIKQLEQVLGHRVFERHGRGIQLTAAGERLLPIARETVRTLDTTLADFHDNQLLGKLRVGLPDDQSRVPLSNVVAAFARQHPRVELEIRCALSTEFQKALDAGRLDLAVHEVAELVPGMQLLQEEPLRWLASKAHRPQNRDPLPVALFDRACWWRDVAIESLEASQRRYRILFSSESANGVLAAVEAGIAVGMLGFSTHRFELTPVASLESNFDLPSSKLVLQVSKRADPRLANAMASAIRASYRASDAN